MYLTRLELDLTKRDTMRALAAPQMFHAAICKAFTDEERYLWRLDKLAGKTYLLVSSHMKPALEAAAEQFGFGTYETRDYDTLLDRIQTGDRWHFRLRANPVVSVSDGTGRGKVLAHVTVAQQEQWLRDRAAKHGFEPETLAVVEREWVSFKKTAENGRPVTLHAVTFEGSLRVTDKELLRKAMTEGIGRGKAYGMGMLTLAGHIIDR